MNKVQNRRLANVAVALEDAAKVPFFVKIFDMGKWGYEAIVTTHDRPKTNNCGTPACAMGHYASRPDLQKMFYLNEAGNLCNTRSGDIMGFDELAKYFGIDEIDIGHLFGEIGCGGADTPKQAAKFIYNFVDKYRARNAK